MGTRWTGADSEREKMEEVACRVAAAWSVVSVFASASAGAVGAPLLCAGSLLVCAVSDADAAAASSGGIQVEDGAILSRAVWSVPQI